MLPSSQKWEDWRTAQMRLHILLYDAYAIAPKPVPQAMGEAEARAETVAGELNVFARG